MSDTDAGGSHRLKKAERDKPLQGGKRQYFPYLLEWNCPDCGTENVLDFRGGGRHGTYISYPEWGEETTVPLLCGECDHVEPVVELSVVPKISLELAQNDRNNGTDTDGDGDGS